MMRKIYSLFISLFACIVFITCKKTENDTVYLSRAKSSFKVSVQDAFEHILIDKTSAPIDSNFYFTNESDTGSNITYHWDFGDGTTSEEQNPKHRYTERGKYIVKLETRVMDLVSGVMEKEVNVIIGETHFDIANQNWRGVDVVQSEDGSFVVLCVSENFENNEEKRIYSLLFLDDHHRELGRKNLPVGNRYFELVECVDGNFLLTASEENETNKIVKVNAEGQLLWSRTYTEIASILETQQTKDAGYLLSCERNLPDINGNPIPRTYLVKLDGDGNREWARFLIDEDALYNTGKVYEDEEGFILSGSDVDFSNVECWSCNTLSLIKIDKKGENLWRHHAPWGISSSSGKAAVFKLQNGQYIVSSWSNKAVYFFSEEDGFLDRKLLPFGAYSTVLTKQGNIAILGEDSGNGSRAVSAGMTVLGTNRWTTRYEGRQLVSGGGYMCCVDSRPEKAIALNNSGSMMLFTRINRTESWGYYYSIVLVELDENGNIM